MTAKSQVAKHQQRLVRKVLKKIAKNDPSTREVVLNGYPFQEESIASLTMSLVNNTHVRILYLHDCGITARGAHLLAYALRKNRSIEHLWLNGNNIGSAGAEAIANSLRENRTMQTLGLGENDIGNHGGKRILESLKHNQVITDIFLEGNRMSERIIDEICMRCDRSIPSTSSKSKQEESQCQFSCGASIDPLEDLDASTVMSSITSSYTRKMLESIVEESEEDDEEDDSPSESDDDSSTVFDQDISCYIAQLTERVGKKKQDKLSKLKSLGRFFHMSRTTKAEA